MIKEGVRKEIGEATKTWKGIASDKEKRIKKEVRKKLWRTKKNKEKNR